jgi:hypothetical protein
MMLGLHVDDHFQVPQFLKFDQTAKSIPYTVLPAFYINFAKVSEQTVRNFIVRADLYYPHL